MSEIEVSRQAADDLVIACERSNSFAVPQPRNWRSLAGQGFCRVCTQKRELDIVPLLAADNSFTNLDIANLPKLLFDALGCFRLWDRLVTHYRSGVGQRDGFGHTEWFAVHQRSRGSGVRKRWCCGYSVSLTASF